MSRQALDLATAEHIELVALPAAVDLLDTLQRFGDLDIDDDAEDKLGLIIQALRQAAGRLMLRTETGDK